MLPEADRLPVRRNLRTNNQRNDYRSNAQRTVPNAHNSRAFATQVRSAAGVEEIAQRIANAVNANLPALVDEWWSIWTRLAWCLPRIRCAAATLATRDQSSEENGDEQESQCAERSEDEERPLNLKSLPEECACAERFKPSRIGEQTDDRTADEEESDENRKEERAQAQLWPREVGAAARCGASGAGA